MSNRRETTPSLRALVFALRHKETWPEGFVWDYAHCDNCAMGLAWKMWPQHISQPGVSEVSNAISANHIDAATVFLGPANMRDRLRVKTPVTPEHIADQLESLDS